MKESLANGKVVGPVGLALCFLFLIPAMSLLPCRTASAETPVFCGDVVDDIADTSGALVTAFEQWTHCGRYDDVNCLRGKGATSADKKRRLDALSQLIKHADSLIALGPDFYGTAYVLLDTVYQRCDGIGPADEDRALADWVRGPAKDELVCALESLKGALLNYEPAPEETSIP